MKRVALIKTAVVLSFTSFTAGQPLEAALITFSFNGAAGNETALAPDAPTVGLTTSDMIRGSGLSAASGAGTFSASGWTTSGSVDLDDYFAFAITPDAGWNLTLTELVLDERRSLSGVRNWAIRSSLDGFASNLGNFAVPDNDSTRMDQTILLPELLFSGLSSAVEFRIYGYGSESGSGTWRIDNVELSGTVSAATVSNVPDTLPSVYAIGALLTPLLLGMRRLRQVTAS